MKKLLVLLALFFSAHTADAAMCQNFGHDILTGDVYDYAVVDAQLAHLTSKGVNCLRLAYIGYGGRTADYLSGNRPDLKLAAHIKVKYPNMRLIIGGAWNSRISTRNFALYDANVIAQATWAQAHGIEQVSIGNEQEYRLSITKSTWAQHLRELAPKVRKVYSGVISYEASGDHAPFWATQTLGGIDLLGVNLYCGYECNLSFLKQVKAKHGAQHVYISETNADMATGWYTDDAKHAAEVQGDALRLLNEGVPVYYFAYSANGGNGVPTYWGLYNGTKLMQPKTAAVLGL